MLYKPERQGGYEGHTNPRNELSIVLPAGSKLEADQAARRNEISLNENSVGRVALVNRADLSLRRASLRNLCVLRILVAARHTYAKQLWVPAFPCHAERHEERPFPAFPALPPRRYLLNCPSLFSHSILFFVSLNSGEFQTVSHWRHKKSFVTLKLLVTRLMLWTLFSIHPYISHDYTQLYNFIYIYIYIHI